MMSYNLHLQRKPHNSWPYVDNQLPVYILQVLERLVFDRPRPSDTQFSTTITGMHHFCQSMFFKSIMQAYNKDLHEIAWCIIIIIIIICNAAINTKECHMVDKKNQWN